MKFIKFLRYDLRNGTAAAWNKYLISLLLFVFICGDFYARCRSFQPPQDYTIADLASYAFAGMREYIPSPYETFRFPALWVLTYALVLYITLYYTDQDMTGFGQLTLLHAGGRGFWWLSKCVWNVLSVLLFFLLEWCVFLIFALCGGCRLSMESSAFMELFLDAGNSFPSTEWILGVTELVVLPAVIAAALSLFQMTLSLFIKPLFSYVVSMVHLIASAYLVSPVLLGNYAMVLRGEQIIENGMDPSVGLIYAAIVGLGSMLVGWISFRRHNVLSKEEN